MSDSHVINSIKYWKRHLENKPEQSIYTWMSDHWDDWAEQENRMNDNIEENVKELISMLEQEAQKRNLIY